MKYLLIFLFSTSIFAQEPFGAIIRGLAQDHREKQLQRQKERLMWYEMNKTSAPTIHRIGLRESQRHCGIRAVRNQFGYIVKHERYCE